MLAAALFALIIGALSLRTTGMHFIMITLAFAQMLLYLCIGLEKYGGDDGIVMSARNTLPGLDLATDSHLYYLCLGLLLLILLGAHRLVRSRFGLVLRAASHNTERIHCLGINAYPHRLDRLRHRRGHRRPGRGPARQSDGPTSARDCCTGPCPAN